MILRKLACLRLLCFAPLLLPVACDSSGSGSTTGTTGSGTTSTGGSGGGNFAISTIVPDGGNNSQALAMAVAPDDRIGVTFFRRIDCADGTDDCPERTIQHVPDYEIHYFEIKDGAIGADALVRVVQNPFGLTVAFQPNGLAAVSYLGFNGGGADPNPPDAGHDTTTPAWFQNDAVISYQQSDGTWFQQTVMQQASEAPVNDPSDPLDDNGDVLGFWPALTFDSTKAYLGFRDGHFGNYTCPNPQDWCSATIRFGEGGPTTWTKSWAVAGSLGSSSMMKQAYGGHNQIQIFNGQPVLAFDQIPGGAGSVGSGGSNVLFAMRGSDGKTWTKPKLLFTSGATQSGPSMAMDPQIGIGVVAVDAFLTSPKLIYTTSSDGVTWTSPDPVVNAGTDGWFPSLAFDTVIHAPHVAYVHCSDQAGVSVPGNCPPSQDELRISHLDPSNEWIVETVDKAGAYLPKIGILSSGKRFVIYRASTADSSIKFALEN